MRKRIEETYCSVCIHTGVCPYDRDNIYSPEYCGKHNDYFHFSRMQKDEKEQSRNK